MPEQTISTITDRVMEGMAEWQSLPLDPVYAVVFIDAINVKIREGQVANRPVPWRWASPWTASVTCWGCGPGSMATGKVVGLAARLVGNQEPRSARCLHAGLRRLKGLPDAVSTVWEKTIVQTCIVHLLRNSFKYASKRDWAQIAKELKPVYTAASEAEALDRFADFSGKWRNATRLSSGLGNAWAEFVPFLQFDREIRTVICTTSAIESINARLRRAVNARGHFPTEQPPCPAMGGRLETGPARPAAWPGPAARGVLSGTSAAPCARPRQCPCTATPTRSTRHSPAGRSS